MREVQCGQCLQFVPLGYAVPSFLTIYWEGTQKVKDSRKMYACCASHHNELTDYYTKRNDCIFRTITK
jgi:hypothetical protein